MASQPSPKSAEQLPAAQRLPFELLSDIFRQVETADWRFGSSRRRNLVLSHVCSHWRWSAINDPKLWTCIGLDLREGRESDALVTEFWLLNSQDLPLTIAIKLSVPHKPISHHPCLPMLISESSRWERADIELPFDMLRPFQGVRHRFPLLRELSVNTMTSVAGESSNAKGYLDIFHSASKLCSLDISDGSERAAESVRLVLPYHRLTACNLSGYGAVDPCLNLLRSCPNLLEWYCDFPRRFDLATSPSHHILHSNLKYWSISCSGEFGSFNQLLDNVSLPALDDFSYNSEYGYTDCNLTLLTSLLLRSSASLTSLRLRSGCEPTSQEIIQCLEACPMLQYLDLRDTSASRVDAVLLRRLTHAVNDSAVVCCLIPLLRSLSVEVYQLFNYQLFAEMVKSRWILRNSDCVAPNHENVNRIQEVQLCRTWYRPAEDEPEKDDEEPPSFTLLRELRAEGLAVSAMDYRFDDVSLEDYPLRREH